GVGEGERGEGWGGGGVGGGRAGRRGRWGGRVPGPGPARPAAGGGGRAPAGGAAREPGSPSCARRRVRLVGGGLPAGAERRGEGVRRFFRRLPGPPARPQSPAHERSRARRSGCPGRGGDRARPGRDGGRGGAVLGGGAAHTPVAPVPRPAVAAGRGGCPSIRSGDVQGDRNFGHDDGAMSTSSWCEVAALVDRRAGATPDAVAFVDGRSDRRLTWA